MSTTKKYWLVYISRLTQLSTRLMIVKWVFVRTAALTVNRCIAGGSPIIKTLNNSNTSILLAGGRWAGDWGASSGIMKRDGIQSVPPSRWQHVSADFTHQGCSWRSEPWEGLLVFLSSALHLGWLSPSSHPVFCFFSRLSNVRFPLLLIPTLPMSKAGAH